MTTGNYRGANGALITSNGHGSDSPEQIEREIEETRARMEQTLAAIRHDLSPGQLVDQALNAFRSGKVGDYARRAGSSFGDVVKENPVPVALIGIGLTWLAVSSSSSRAARASTGVTAEPSGAPAVPEPAESTAARMKERIEGTASEWKERASGYAHGASDRARVTTRQAKEQARRARDASSRAYQDNPLLMGVAAIGIGALVGALFPSTPQEGRLLGERRDRLLRKADESAGRALHKVTEKIEERGSMEPSPSQPSGIDTGPAADVYGDETLKR